MCNSAPDTAVTGTPERWASWQEEESTSKVTLLSRSLAGSKLPACTFCRQTGPSTTTPTKFLKTIPNNVADEKKSQQGCRVHLSISHVSARACRCVWLAQVCRPQIVSKKKLKKKIRVAWPRAPESRHTHNTTLLTSSTLHSTGEGHAQTAEPELTHIHVHFSKKKKKSTHTLSA